MYKPLGIIYLIKNKQNGKCYVGQTQYSLAHRWSGHCRAKSPIPISRAIKKYGRDGFIKEVLFVAFSEDALDEAERQLIRAYDCIVPRGYNLYSGGNKHKKAHPSTRLKQSISNTKHRVVGIHIKTGDRITFRNMMEAHRTGDFDWRNIYAVCTKRAKSHANYVWFFEEEAPESIKYENKALPKAVKGISIKDGKEIIFQSTKKAETEGHFLRKEVSEACRGKRNRIYRGYIWSYA